MERQQEIDQQFGFLVVLLLIVLTGYLFVQHANRQFATPEQLQSIIHDTPCAAEAIRMALQANTGTSSTSLTFNDAKKWLQNARIKKRLKQYVKNNLTH